MTALAARTKAMSVKGFGVLSAEDEEEELVEEEEVVDIRQTDCNEEGIKSGKYFMISTNSHFAKMKCWMAFS